MNTEDELLITVVIVNDCVTESMLYNATPLLEAKGDRRTSNVQETPHVVHGFTWVDLHAKATRSKRGVG